jgi:hypothetical protein
MFLGVVKFFAKEKDVMEVACRKETTPKREINMDESLKMRLWIVNIVYNDVERALIEDLSYIFMSCKKHFEFIRKFLVTQQIYQQAFYLTPNHIGACL